MFLVAFLMTNPFFLISRVQPYLKLNEVEHRLKIKLSLVDAFFRANGFRFKCNSLEYSQFYGCLCSPSFVFRQFDVSESEAIVVQKHTLPSCLPITQFYWQSISLMCSFAIVIGSYPLWRWAHTVTGLQPWQQLLKALVDSLSPPISEVPSFHYGKIAVIWLNLFGVISS